MAVSSEGLVELVLGKEDLKPVGGVWWRGDLKSDCDDRDFNMDEPTMEEKHSSLDMLNDESSLHILFRQALHAEDHALLQLDCLYTRDEKVYL
uniref:Uncharacterized protein n=1 Tax=Musa acuminata subsp. malaccensis TaxID=214687 RepID=A0A804JC41_MUSAM